jgi:hypothetical protein
MAYTFSATSELYHDGYNDDGTKTIKELYFITATSHYGEVYAYTGDLTGRDIDRVIDGTSFVMCMAQKHIQIIILKLRHH